MYLLYLQSHVHFTFFPFIFRIKINGKDNDDEPELDRKTGELKVTNRPGPKSAKLKQRKSLPESPKVDSTPGRGTPQRPTPGHTETKMVNGQKMKVT